MTSNWLDTIINAKDVMQFAMESSDKRCAALKNLLKNPLPSDDPTAREKFETAFRSAASAMKRDVYYHQVGGGCGQTEIRLTINKQPPSEIYSLALLDDILSLGSFSLVCYSRWMGGVYRDLRIRGTIVHETSNFCYLIAETLEWREKESDEIQKKTATGIGFDLYTFDTTQKESNFDCMVMDRGMVGPSDNFDVVLKQNNTRCSNSDLATSFVNIAGRNLLFGVKFSKTQQMPSNPQVGFLSED